MKRGKNDRTLGLFFIMAMLIVSYPSLHAQIATLSPSDLMQNALRVILPIAILTVIIMCGGMVVYENWKNA